MGIVKSASLKCMEMGKNARVGASHWTGNWRRQNAPPQVATVGCEPIRMRRSGCEGAGEASIWIPIRRWETYPERFRRDGRAKEECAVCEVFLATNCDGAANFALNIA